MLPDKKQKNRRRTSSLILIFCIAWTMTITTTSPWAFDLRKVDPSQAAALKNVTALDARPEKEWRHGHIAGSFSFSWEKYTRADVDGVRWRIFSPEELAGTLGALGVGHDDGVLVYGDADTSWGGEGWLVWMLAWLGHQGPVYFLDGGIQGWRAAGLSVTTDAGGKRDPKNYEVRLQTGMNITADEIEARRGTIHLVDNRGYLKEWLPGRLPGAVHIGWERFYQGRNRQVLSPEQLKALLLKQGVDLKKPVVYYCTGGIRSGYAWLVHQLAGLPAAVNFEGGTEEWTLKRSLRR